LRGAIVARLQCSLGCSGARRACALLSQSVRQLLDLALGLRQLITAIHRDEAYITKLERYSGHDLFDRQFCSQFWPLWNGPVTAQLQS
jgi:hypothetical protein